MNTIEMAERLELANLDPEEVQVLIESRNSAVEARRSERPDTWQPRSGRAVASEDVIAWGREQGDHIFAWLQIGNHIFFEYDPDAIQEEDCPQGVSLKEHGLLLAYKPARICGKLLYGRCDGWLDTQAFMFDIAGDGSVAWPDFAGIRVEWSRPDRDRVTHRAARFIGAIGAATDVKSEETHFLREDSERPLLLPTFTECTSVD